MKMRIVYLLTFLTFSFSLVSAQTFRQAFDKADYNYYNGNRTSYYTSASSLPSAYQGDSKSWIHLKKHRSAMFKDTINAFDRKRFEFGIAIGVNKSDPRANSSEFLNYNIVNNKGNNFALVLNYKLLPHTKICLEFGREILYQKISFAVKYNSPEKYNYTNILHFNFNYLALFFQESFRYNKWRMGFGFGPYINKMQKNSLEVTWTGLNYSLIKFNYFKPQLLFGAIANFTLGYSLTEHLSIYSLYTYIKDFNSLKNVESRWGFYPNGTYNVEFSKFEISTIYNF